MERDPPRSLPDGRGTARPGYRGVGRVECSEQQGRLQRCGRTFHLCRHALPKAGNRTHVAVSPDRRIGESRILDPTGGHPQRE